MFPDAREVRLGPDERAELEAWLRAPTSEQPCVPGADRADGAEGLSTRAIARDLGTMPRTVTIGASPLRRRGAVRSRRSPASGRELSVRAALRRGVLRAENSAYGRSYAQCLRAA